MEFKTPVKGRSEALEVLSKAAVRWEDRESALRAVAGNGLLLSRAPTALRGDRDMVLAAVRHNGLALHYASDALRGDREVAAAAVTESGLALEFVAPRFRADRTLVLQAVAENGAAFEYAANELREDREFVLQAVEHSARVLTHAADFLLADQSFITAAIKRNSWALGYAPKKLHKDRGLILDRWHTPPKPHEPAPSQLPGLHVTELPRPQWQASLPRRRRTGASAELTALPGEFQLQEAEPFPFPGAALPAELERARLEACEKVGIFRKIVPNRRDPDLFRRVDLKTRFTSTLPAELELARQAACREACTPRVGFTLPAELEIARQTAYKKAIMTAR